MFFPTRYENFAVYDIKLLLSCDTEFEEYLFVNATKLIPEIFGIGEQWGEELTPSCIWIPAKEHDITYKRIRELLRSDQEFVISATTEIKKSIQVAYSILTSSSDQEILNIIKVSYLKIIRAVGWFSCNWLNPIISVRQTLINVFGSEKMLNIFNELLKGDYQSRYISNLTDKNNISLILNKNNDGSIDYYDLENCLHRVLNQDSTNLLLAQINFLQILPQEEEYRRLMITRINEVYLNNKSVLNLHNFIGQ